MLDQNTDRMWYVIGAIVIGAAIIAMGLNIFSDSFDSVDSMMTGLMDIAGDNTSLVGGGLYSEPDIDKLVSEGYIPISSADDLNRLRHNQESEFAKDTRWEGSYQSGLDKKYVQVANIDLSGYDNWDPIGRYGIEFTGIYDGSDYSVDNLKIANEYSINYNGLFGRTLDAEVHNVHMRNVHVVGGLRTGGLVGHNYRSIITNSSSTGYVLGGHDTGGLVGSNEEDSRISRSHSEAEVRSHTAGNTGGLSGWNGFSSIGDNSYATGSVIGEGDVGGLVGDIGPSGIVRNSYSVGNVTAKSNSAVGGLVGRMQGGAQIYSSFTLGSAKGHTSSGFLVGTYGESNVVEDSYYILDPSSDSTALAGIGLNHDDMSNITDRLNWDFNHIWLKSTGSLPKLRK